MIYYIMRLEKCQYIDSYLTHVRLYPGVLKKYCYLFVIGFCITPIFSRLDPL